jgi:Carboxypeptidase regulatory-like domain
VRRFRFHSAFFRLNGSPSLEEEHPPHLHKADPKSKGALSLGGRRVAMQRGRIFPLFATIRRKYMPFKHGRVFCITSLVALLLAALGAFAQSGNGGDVHGTVADPTGAVIPGATVTLTNPVSGYSRVVQSNAAGQFDFTNIPFNNYMLGASAKGFSSARQSLDVHSIVAVASNLTLKIAAESTTVTVEATADLLENDPTAHVDVDRGLFDKLPLESESSSLSSLVTLASPGVAADSNGLFHGLGDHAENSFSVDGQSITDQQSKVFSNQVPVDSIESLEVISGAPPAEYGDKTSLVIVATTRSGQGMKTPHGQVDASYGAFGTGEVGFNLGYGGDSWGNFISVNGLNTGRFLDPPEFAVIHDHGNEENVFDRVDYKFSAADSAHMNLEYSRSWFQNPNSFDQQSHLVNGVQLTNPLNPSVPLGYTDQHSKIGTFNIAPTWTHLFGTSSVLTVAPYVRKDQFNYYPSKNFFNDLSPDLQGQAVTQSRNLTNLGIRSDISYVKGMHDIKAGITYQQTFLNEGDGIGIVDPALVPGLGCLDPVTQQPVPGTPCAILAPYDLTGGGGAYTPGVAFPFHGHTDVKETSMYVRDAISAGNWSFNLGIRGDIYNGISRASQAEPRVGISYKVKPSNSILKISYARTLETPFNENLVIGSTGCSVPFLATITPPPGVSCALGAIQAGFRNEFHAGIQQSLGRHLVIDGEYIWKYTHNGYDFGVVGSTPITFPIEWHSSKIPGFTLRASVPETHGLTAFVVMSGVAARFFLPQVAGLPIIPPSTGVFRIDHDEVFNQSSHVQYQPFKRAPWVSFNWRYDSGLVAGATPCEGTTATCSSTTSTADGGANSFIPSGYVALLNTISGAPLTADQEFQAGFYCGSQRATPTAPIGTPFNNGAEYACPATEFGSRLLKVPAPFKENDDHNPQRVQPRSVFDLAIGHDDLFHGDKYKWGVNLTAVNVANQYALYNFLSTFSGTHYVTPRAMTAKITLNF